MSLRLRFRSLRQVFLTCTSIIFSILGNTVLAPAYAGELTASIELGIEKILNSTSGPREDLNTTNKTQRYMLDYSNYLYRPWFADYRIGGTFSKTDTDRNSLSSDIELKSYRLNGKFFPNSPFPLSLYAISNDTDITIQTNPDSKIESKLYGADLKLDFYTLPTTTLFYYGQTTFSNLSSALNEQDSNTAGINLLKRWDSLTANLRYEDSEFSEKYTAQMAQSNRLMGSFVYRPSDALHASFVFTDYTRDAQQSELQFFDPLYSDRDSTSHNFTMLWNPKSKLNMSAYANYFLEDYAGSNRKAKDGQVNADYWLTNNLSAFVSGYVLRSELNGVGYDSQDKRTGLNYSRADLLGNLELNTRVSGGYFFRTTETAEEIKKKDDYFYLVGGRAEYNIIAGNTVLSPYYDINYSNNKQTNIFAVESTQQEAGFRLDGIIAGGRLDGNVSYTLLDQKSNRDVDTAQFRSFLRYEHRMFRRATLGFQAGASNSKGSIEDTTFESITQNEDTESKSSYSHLDFTTPVLGSNVLCNSSLRYEKRENHGGAKETDKLLDIRFTHQLGKLFSEAGFLHKQSLIDDVKTRESIWYVKVRRDFSFGSKS